MNNSSPKQVKKEHPLYKILQQVRANGGTITYFFETERYDIRNDISYLHKSSMVSDINLEIFYKQGNNRKVQVDLDDIVSLFHSIKTDIGAKYFIIG